MMNGSLIATGVLNFIGDNYDGKTFTGKSVYISEQFIR